MAVLGVLIILLIMVVRFATREKPVGVTVAAASRELALMLADRETVDAAEDSRFKVLQQKNKFANVFVFTLVYSSWGCVCVCFFFMSSS